MKRPRHAEMLESLYRRLNRREYVHPDPLEFLYRYERPRDRDLVALVASGLAYGRVRQILRSVSAVLAALGPAPGEYAAVADPAELRGKLRGFRHRFVTGRNVAAMLAGAGRLIRRHGSLKAAFLAGAEPGHQTVLPALGAFVGRLTAAAPGETGHLLPDPARGSACKRLNLMLRWLVRSDRVDPGGWESVGPEKLIVPLDTHMHRIARSLGLTSRKSADLRTALEITAAFRRISPADPVRYDFALTRLGIREDMDVSAFLARCRADTRERAYA